MAGHAAPVDPPAAWVEITASPVALAEAPRDGLERALLARCGTGEAGLGAAARDVVSRKLRRLPMPEPDDIALAQRSAGEPHPWARAWAASAKSLPTDVTLRELDAWLADDRTPRLRRCAVASGESPDGTRAVAVVAVDALADLAPLPTRGRTGQWLTVEATLRVKAEGGTVVILEPGGAPRRVPAWFDGTTLRARFVLDRPGDFAVQVVAATSEGPRPVIEASVFADVEPPALVPAGEVALAQPSPPIDARDEASLTGALASGLASARATAGEPPLQRDARLDAVARAHALRMAADRELAHDAGDGDPEERLRAAGLAAQASGENVAHAATVTLAHAALWASPSHRANMLRRDFDRVGLAVVRDGRGDVWAVETFASGLQ
jgi:uncharacterized protein YkwD